MLSTPALAAVGWRGDFETGDLSQWPFQQLVSQDRAQLVETPVFEGRYAARFSVQQGDDPINSSGNRNELAGDEEPEGTEVYYRWATRFDPSFPSEEKFQVFTQWHGPEGSGAPPIAFEVIGEEIMLFLNGWEGLVWQTPLVRDVWHEFIVHVKFSDDPKVGFLEVWHDGQKVLEKTHFATRANAYLKQGLYRDAAVQGVGIVFHDGMIRGDTLEDVMGAPAPAPSPTEPADPNLPVDPVQPTPDAPSTGATPPVATQPTDTPEALATGCSSGGVAAGGVGLLLLASLLSRARRH